MLKVEGEEIRYGLKLIEKIGAFGSEPKAKLANLVSASISNEPWTREVLKGIRAPGTGFPYLIMLGTLRYRGGKDFCVVYKRNPVLIIEFTEESFKRWIIPANSENLSVVRNLGKLGH